MNTLLLTAALLAPAGGDLLFVNGRVWTGPADGFVAQPVAVSGGRIVERAAADATTIDLAGKFVVPGFHDSHLHLLGGGRMLSQVALTDCRDAAEFATRVKAFDEKLPRDRWLLGGGWDHERAFRGTLPSVATLDACLRADRPALLRRVDGHMALANRRALQLAGVTAATADPPGGVIDRLPGGREPSGILRDTAIGLVERVVPPPDDAEIAEAVRAALAAFARVGVTGVEDMDGSPPATRRRYHAHLRALDAAGTLTCRVNCYWPLAEAASVAGESADWTPGLVRVGGVKGFADGSLGSRTAKLFAPYADDATTAGLYVTPRSALAQQIVAADRLGLRLAVHAIGDEANATLLDIYAKLPPGRRPRVEHAQHLRPADIERFAASGAIASVQPRHAIDDAPWAATRLGAGRLAGSYAYRSLLAKGAAVAFGTDWPVASLDPRDTLRAAVEQPSAGERLSWGQAMEAYTAGSAFAAGQEGERGRVTPGFVADLAVFSGNPLAGGKVVMTVVAGRVVFRE